MSDLIRAMMNQRQNMGGEMDLDDPTKSMEEQIAMALEAGLVTPEELMRAGLLPEGSIGQQMMERFSPQARPTLQNEMAGEDAPMSPMISSVTQLDR